MFIKRRIPITHAVEPANIAPPVVEWLLHFKNEYPDLVEIMQHGYDHTVKNQRQIGEFGGQRTYGEQYADIRSGKDLMNHHFGDQWFECFNFPYAPYNPAAIRAVNDVGYKVLNSHFNCDWRRQLFYRAGHLLRRGHLLNHHVSWNLQRYPGTDLFEIDMNISFIGKYLDEESASEMLTIEQLQKETRMYSRYRTVGVLLHHRYHNTEDKIALVEEYLEWCSRQPGVVFMNLESIYERFRR
jgi:hypothetical protein